MVAKEHDDASPNDVKSCPLFSQEASAARNPSLATAAAAHLHLDFDLDLLIGCLICRERERERINE